MSGATTDPSDRSSAEIEREVERSRARLAGTLGELRERASPGQLFEQALDYAKRSGGADFTRNLGASVRDNPLPLLLIGAGIGWLMMSDRRSGTDGGMTGRERLALPPSGGGRGVDSRPYVQNEFDDDGAPSTMQRASDALSGAKARAGEAAGGLGDSVSGAAGRVGEAAGSAYRAATEAAGSAAESVGSGAGSAARGATDVGRDARDNLGRASDSAREGLGWLVREQPLVLGAIGIAVGAAVGALLPATGAEDRLAGEARDNFAERAKTAAEQGIGRAKEAAGEHLERASDRMSASGPADRAAAALGETVRDVREAVRGVAQDAADQAKNATNAEDAPTRSPPTRHHSEPREASVPAPAKAPSDPARTGPL